VITVGNQLAIADIRERLRDAFRLIMDAQLVLRVPEKVTDRRTGKDMMKNKVVDLLEQKQLGSHIDTTGHKFIDLLTDVLWYVIRPLRVVGFLLHTFSVKNQWI
jgi:hypothetical protein